MGDHRGEGAPRPPHVGPIDVLLIDGNQKTREGLAVLIEGTPGFRCTGYVRSIEEALPGLAERLPHVALVETDLPGLSGIAGTRLLKDRHPSVLTLILTAQADDDRIFEALCAGARGYLLKSTPPGRLLDSIREAVGGGAPMSPEIARRVIGFFRENGRRDNGPPRDADYRLTPHESRLLKLLVDGHSYRTAAAQLSVSVNTVSFHMRRIYDKLAVHSKSAAVAKALREHLIR